MRPTDLAREHGISTQAVRNYENAGFIPQAHRTPSGYRRYTAIHAGALRAYLSLIAAFGYATAGEIMTTLNRGHLDQALEAIDQGHVLLLRDRSTLRTVENALSHMDDAETQINGNSEQHHASLAPFSIGELGRRLDVTPATLRNWERKGILTPRRDRVTGHRSYNAEDIRDAEVAHLLRRGGYPLEDISAVTHQIRTGGGTSALSKALQAWKDRVTSRGLAMLTAAANLDRYTHLIQSPPDPPGN